MPVYFFTQPDLLQAQLPSQPFGPITGIEQTQYRVCSLHSFSSDAVAYAVTKGDVKIQPIGGDAGTLVNLILKPENIGFVPGLEIRYIIYRGILKSSVIAGTIIAPSSTSDLTAGIWDQQAKMIIATAHSSIPITGDPPSSILGYNLQTLPDTGSIDQLFISNPNIANATIDMGKSVGKFGASSGGGIEILMDGYFSDDSLASVRMLDHIVTAPTFDSSYANKAIREKVISYLDPCAFYGMVGPGTITVRDSTGHNISPSKTDFFNSILYPKFLNNGIIYLDIRNESGASFVYHKSNYGFNLKNFNLQGSVTPTFTYAVNNWPIFSLQTAGLFNSTYSRRPPNDTTPYVSFQFGFDKETYEIRPILYFPYATTNFTVQSRFLNSTNDDGSAAISGGQPIISFSSANDQLFLSGKVFLELNCHVADSSITQNIVISNYISVFYFKQIDSANPGSSSAIFPTVSNFDNLFIFRAVPPNGTIPNGGLVIYKSGVKNFVNYKFSVNQNSNLNEIQDPRYISGVFESYIAFEANRVTVFALIKDVFKYRGDFIEPNVIADGEKNDFSSLFKYIQGLFIKQVQLGKHTIAKGTSLTPFLNFTQVFDPKTSVATPFIFFGASVTTTEFTQLATAISSNSLSDSYYPIFIPLQNITNAEDDDHIFYNSAKFNVRGIQQNGTTLNQLSSPINIDVYSADYLFCSKAAADLEQLDVTVYNGNSFSPLKVTISDELQSTLTNLSLEKQHLFDNLLKLDIFNQYLRKTSASAVVPPNPYLKAQKLIFDVQEAINALADTTPKGRTLVDGTITGTFSIVIRIDPTYLVEGSTTSIIRTIIHELEHASIDYQVALIGGVAASGATLANKLRASHNSNGRILGDYYCAFGDTDGPAPASPNDSVNERSYQHNYMAKYLRTDMNSAAAQYESIVGITRSDVQMNITDIFKSSPDNVVLETITANIVYDALSWQGLDLTREWRRAASVSDASRQLFQVYTLIAIYEIASMIYPVPPAEPTTPYMQANYRPVPNKITPICHVITEP
ncbi:MAG: hypothetical protein ACHQIM_00410 [Sphingobacteriales bacterium]